MRYTVFMIYTEPSECEENLTPNIVKLIRLLLVNPTTSWPLRNHFQQQETKTWLRLTMRNKRFDFCLFYIFFTIVIIALFGLCFQFICILSCIWICILFKCVYERSVFFWKYHFSFCVVISFQLVMVSSHVAPP